MTDIKMSELGLAEFVAGLISETFEAVSASMEDQLVRQAGLVSAAEMDLDAYAQQYVSDEAVDQACLTLFGDGSDADPIVVGGIYVPGAAETESPPIERNLGIRLVRRDDYRRVSGRYQFTQKGVEKIRQEIRLRAAQHHQDALHLVLNKGLPRVIVDSGRVLSKVTFNLTESETASAASEAATTQPAATSLDRSIKLVDATAFKTSLLNRLSTTRTNLLLPNMQMKVKPASDESSQSSTKSVYGEVEITFKTVT